jgi:uncharacterized protein YbjT (DUF2867 family)
MMERVLVVGATGRTGFHIMEILARSAVYRPVAMVRRPIQAERFDAIGIESVFGDLEGDVRSVPSGFGRVIFAAGSTGSDFHGIDQEGAKRFIDACAAARVGKFIMLSAMGADAPQKHDVLREYMLAKQAADLHLRASGLAFSICQPGYLNDQPARGRISIANHLIGFGVISRRDVAATLVACLPQDVALNRLFVIWNGDIPIQQALDSLGQRKEPAATID